MALIKIGNLYFNLDNATTIEDLMGLEPPQQKNRLDISWVGLEEGWSIVDDADADALRSYLQRTATDLLGPAENDRDYKIYHQRGGELGYDAWQDASALLSSYHSKSETWWENPANQRTVAALESELKL